MQKKDELGCASKGKRKTFGHHRPVPNHPGKTKILKSGQFHPIGIGLRKVTMKEKNPNKNL